MAGYTQIKRPIKLRMPYKGTFVSVSLFDAAITSGVTTTTEPVGSLAIDNTVPSLFISDGTHWVALATQSATPSFTTITVSGAATLSGGGTITSASLVTPTVKDLTEVVTATNVITAAETGSVFFLNSATEFASTLPAPAAGLHFTFIVTAAPSGASYTVGTNAAATIIKGHAVSSAGATGASSTTGVATLTFVDSQAVVGDRAEFWCDGTNWWVFASSKVVAGITLS